MNKYPIIINLFWPVPKDNVSVVPMPGDPKWLIWLIILPVLADGITSYLLRPVGSAQRFNSDPERGDPKPKPMVCNTILLTYKNGHYKGLK